MNPVQWPGNAYDAEGKDLSAPIQQLLRDLNLLEGQVHDDKGNPAPLTTNLFTGTPPALQVITSGATALSKGWATLVGLFGGGTALWTALQGFGADPQDEPLQRAVFVVSAAVIMAAAVISIAVIVKADVAARAEASAAEYEARARVADALLNSFQYGRPLPLPKGEPRYWLRKKDGPRTESKWYGINGFEFDDRNKELVAIVDGGVRVPVGSIGELASGTAMMGS